jgi:predicted LPLAT superfamily acyltransferase
VLRPLAERVELPRHERAAAAARHAQAYVNQVEAVLRDAPYEWYNFFDFWAQPAGTPLAGHGGAA